ncbi:hypothetical protein BS78_05G264300 [Paspalum vaginatum]|nr:hypothetical protein BS78_05G264300 [Paspalum vaginatum]
MLGEAAPRKTGLPAAPRGSQLLCGLSVDPLSRHLFLNSASQQELMSFLGYFRCPNGMRGKIAGSARGFGRC